MSDTGVYMDKAFIKRHRCVTCRRCIKVCESGAISMDGDSCVVDPALCTGCRSCTGACRTDAIIMVQAARAAD